MKLDDRLDCIRNMLGVKNPPTVKSICEGYSQMSTENGDRAINIIQTALPFIFDFDFPFYDDTHRQELETKIVKNYYFRQICCEDVDEWKLRMSNKLMLIMPYYNDLYGSLEYLKGNILEDVDYERKVDEGTNKSGLESTKTSQTTENSSHNESVGLDSDVNSDNKKSIGRASDTPQNQLLSIEDNTYLTSANIVDENGDSSRSAISNRQSDNEGNTESAGTFDTMRSDNGQRDMTEHVKGKMGMKSKASMVMEYRKAILNIDMEIVNRLSDLFMNVYNVWGE